MGNILLACDNSYYKTWTINCIRSIQYYVPWIKISVVIVNPEKDLQKIDNVDYYLETSEFNTVPYYQAIRFLKCCEIFPHSELVMSIDCDTVLTRSFTPEEFESITETVHVQRHQKDKRWMAGLVTYGKDNKFRNRLKEELLSVPIENWIYGRDQDVLEKLSSEFHYKKLMVGEWMSFGRGRGTFLTLKGEQKNSPGYLDNYNLTLRDIK